MNQKQIRAAVEAMLFACGEPIGSDKLAQAVQLPQTSVENALEELRTRYTREDSGLCLLHLNTRWQLATKTEWADCVRRVLDSRRAVPLGPAAMETLTVIAYNQPVSRAFIEQVRGVDSSSSVSGLLELPPTRATVAICMHDWVQRRMALLWRWIQQPNSTPVPTAPSVWNCWLSAVSAEQLVPIIFLTCAIWVIQSTPISRPPALFAVSAHRRVRPSSKPA